MSNRFFGHIQGPFENNVEIVDLILEQDDRESDFSYFSKIGIHYIGNYDLDISFSDDNIENDNENKISYLYVLINGISFRIGKTRMLELEDAQITSIIFPNDTTDEVYIDYQYEKEE